MFNRSLHGFLSYSIGFATLSVIVFGAMRFLNISTGQLVDWIVGVLSAWWMLLIVTVPWNIFFEAQDLINEAKESTAAKIAVDPNSVRYAQKVARVALLGALSLHVFTAVVLFCLSYFHITPVGQIASIAALLLTALRPVVRGYEHLSEKLRLLKQRVRYPREDVVELRNLTLALEGKVRELESALDEKNPSSFATRMNRLNEDTRQRLTMVTSLQQKADIEHREQHEMMILESRTAVAKIGQDMQFLEHVREILRFIKTA
jgi:hypothetical protein